MPDRHAERPVTIIPGPPHHRAISGLLVFATALALLWALFFR